MALISDDELESRRGVSQLNCPEKADAEESTPADRSDHKPQYPGGNAVGRPHLSPDERAIVGALGRSPLPNGAIAESLGLSTQSVSNYANGRVGTRHDSELKENVDDRTAVIRDAAMERMLEALNLIEEKADTIKDAKTAASIAKDMSQIVDKVRDRSKGGDANVNVIFYVPGRKEVSDYEVIDAQAHSPTP